MAYPATGLLLRQLDGLADCNESPALDLLPNCKERNLPQMKTWTCTDFKGHYPVGTALVVTADNVQLAITMVETQLIQMGLQQTIKPVQLVPLPTHHRHVRILCDGDY